MYERMLDKTKVPTKDELTEYCGNMSSLFTSINDWLTDAYETESKTAFPYGNNYGWGISHRKKKKLICNVFAEKCAFTVMLRLSEKQFQSVYSRLSKYTQDVIDNKYPCAAAELEELIATGFSKFIVCGAAGVIQKGIQVGHLVVPYSAVRDEGVSYHYAEPSREIECNKHAVNTIEKVLQGENIPYIKAKTWSTDAFYRETEEKMELRVSEGCVTVEMEAAAFFAVSKFRNVTLGQILFGGDDLSGVEWNSRRWISREQIRRSLVELSFKVCLQL